MVAACLERVHPTDSDDIPHAAHRSRNPDPLAAALPYRSYYQAVFRLYLKPILRSMSSKFRAHFEFWVGDVSSCMPRRPELEIGLEMGALCEDPLRGNSH